MKSEIKQTTRVSAKTALKIKLAWMIAIFSILSILMFVLFVYFFTGNPLQSNAANGTFSSYQTGDWISSSTWNGTPPSTLDINGDNITINSGHTVTRIGDLDIKNETTITIASGATLIIDGKVTVNNNLELNVDGTLIISGDLIAKNEASVAINSTGNVEISGSAEFGNDTNFIINGSLNIGENLTFGSNPNFIGNGSIELGGLGCSYWEGGGTCVENVTLPVELLSFAAEKGRDHITLKWETSSELNNDFFSLQKSKDGIDFTTIEKIKGNGTTQSASRYEYVDGNPFYGVSYYRLMQTDYDGGNEIFRPLSVNYNGKPETGFSVYPNPLSGHNLSVKLENAGNGSIRIYDSNGKVVHDRHISDHEANNLEINLEENLERGVYFVVYKTKSFEKSIKLVKL